MNKIKELNLMLDDAYESLQEFKTKGDKSTSKTLEYLIRCEFITPITVQVNSVTALCQNKQESFTQNHYILTDLGNEAYGKLKRYHSIPKIFKSLYVTFAQLK